MNMNHVVSAVVFALCAATIIGVTSATAQQNPVTAIDIALEPDATMIQHAQADNARLLKALPERLCSGRDTPPAHHHASAVRSHRGPRQGLRRSQQALANEKATSWKLKAFKYYYIPSPPIGIAGIVIETDERFTQAATGATSMRLRLSRRKPEPPPHS